MIWTLPQYDEFINHLQPPNTRKTQKHIHHTTKSTQLSSWRWESLKIYQFTLSSNKFAVFEDISPWLLQPWEVLGLSLETHCEEYHGNPKVAGHWEEFPSETGNDPHRLSRKSHEEKAKRCLLAVLVVEWPPTANRKPLKPRSKHHSHQFDKHLTQLIPHALPHA